MTLTIAELKSLLDLYAPMSQTQATLVRIEQKVDALIMTNAEALKILQQIDATTNGIASNVTTIGTSVSQSADAAKTIDTEVKALLGLVQTSANVDPQVAEALQALADKTSVLAPQLDAANTALAAQVPVLQAIAAEGSTAVPPPPPPPPAPGV